MLQSDLKKVNKLSTFPIMIDSFRVAHVQIMTIMIELKKVLSQKLKHLFVYHSYHGPIRVNHTKTIDINLLHFYCNRNK